MEILLIRHGLPLRVESDRPVDPPLAPEGHEQAAALADWLVREPPDHLVSSTMNRAVETAHHLAGTFDLTATSVDELCEFDRGSRAYIPLEELDRDHPHMIQLIEDWVGPTGAARRAEFQTRVVTSLVEQITDLDAERVAVVCHGGVINVIVAHVIGCPPKMFFEPAYTSISRITWNGRHFRLRSVNESAHLRSLEET